MPQPEISHTPTHPAPSSLIHPALPVVAATPLHYRCIMVAFCCILLQPCCTLLQISFNKLARPNP